MNLYDICENEGRMIKADAKRHPTKEQVYACNFKGECAWKYDNVVTIATTQGKQKAMPICGYKAELNKKPIFFDEAYK